MVAIPLVCPNCMSSNLNIIRNSSDIKFKCNTCSWVTYEPKEISTRDTTQYRVNALETLNKAQLAKDNMIKYHNI